MTVIDHSYLCLSSMCGQNVATPGAFPRRRAASSCSASPAPCTPACSKALAAVLADAHVFDLSPADAHRAAETVAFEPIRAGWVLADAADAVTDRAIAAQLDRDTRLRRRMAVGLALHRAARVLEAGG